MSRLMRVDIRVVETSACAPEGDAFIGKCVLVNIPDEWTDKQVYEEVRHVERAIRQFGGAQEIHGQPTTE